MTVVYKVFLLMPIYLRRCIAKIEFTGSDRYLAKFLMSFVFCLLRAWRALICPVYRFLRYEFFQVKPISEIISAIFELDNGWAWWGCPIPGKDFLELQGHRNDQGQTLIFNLKNIIQFQIHPDDKSRALSDFSCPDRRWQGVHFD